LEEEKNYSIKETEIRLKPTKYRISTFRDLADLREMKKWVDEKMANYVDLELYIDKMRMQSLECGRSDLFEEWKRDNLMSFLSFDSLNKLKDKMHVKICEFCGIAFQGIYKNRMYCSNICKLKAFNRKKKLKT